MNSGKIKFYNEAKGFGFIIQDSGDKDIFFHVSGVNSALVNVDGSTLLDPKGGQAVVYEIGSSDKGPIAKNVQFA